VRYRVVRTGEDTLAGTVVFAIAEPADEHEQIARLRLSYASWQSQGSPEALYVTLTAPAPEEPT
jgi:hypothetical protein